MRVILICTYIGGPTVDDTLSNLKFCEHDQINNKYLPIVCVIATIIVFGIFMMFEFCMYFFIHHDVSLSSFTLTVPVYIVDVLFTLKF